LVELSVISLQISKLVGFGANILAPVAYSSKLHVGTVVDYAHWTFARDTRIAHTPYHALTPKVIYFADAAVPVA